MLDKSGPKRSPINKAFKENGIRFRTKTILLDKGEVYI